MPQEPTHSTPGQPVGKGRPDLQMIVAVLALVAAAVLVVLAF